MNFEKECAEIDFSSLSKVKKSLLVKLHKELNQKQTLKGMELGLEEMDFVVAAGNMTPKKSNLL